MAELKTKPTAQQVADFLNTIDDTQKRDDCLALVRMMQEVTQTEPQMWGANIVGFGTYRYAYASGRTGEFFRCGFSPRKQNITLYITSGFEQHASLLQALGKHSCGKSCLYIKRLADIDQAILRRLIHESVEHMKKSHPEAAPAAAQP